MNTHCINIFAFPRDFLKSFEYTFRTYGSYFVIYVSILSLLWISRLSLLYCLICSMQPCDHLLGKGCPPGSLVCDVSLCFVTFPYGVLGQVWYSNVSISDLRLLLYFYNSVATLVGHC